MSAARELFLVGEPSSGAVELDELLDGLASVRRCSPSAALGALLRDDLPAGVVLANDGDLTRLELLRGIKALFGAGAPPCLVLVDADRRDLLAHALEAGAADALLLPFRAADLQARLSAHMRLPCGDPQPRTFTADCFAAASNGNGRGGYLFGELILVADMGGVGITRVFKAVRSDGSLACVKLLDPAVASQDEDWSRRFAREQSILQGIEHENLVRIRDGGDLHGIPYLDMDFYPGESLDQVIDRLGAVAEGLALDVVTQIARGLGALHARNIIHRDLKPENILIDHQGKVRVCDFGLSKPQDDAGLTHEGEILGTVAFIAPETLTGGTPGFSSDIYALGVTLFEMLTGEDAIKPGPTQVMFQDSVRGSAQARALRFVEGRLRPVVSRMLAVDPSDRYASVDGLLEDLERLRAS
jgi:CheY-like chemotaxis protein